MLKIKYIIPLIAMVVFLFILFTIDVSSRAFAVVSSVKENIDDTVLPPWVPIVAKGNNVSVWGREYVFSSGALPSSVTTAGASILYSPIKLRAWVNGQETFWQTQESSLTNIKKSQVTYYSLDTSSDLTLESTSITEYDGMIKVDVTVTPKNGTVSLDSLILEIHVKNENATYYHYAETSGWGASNSGSVPANGWSTKVFKPFVWLGDDDRGLAWFSENAKSWYVPKGLNFIEIKRVPEATTLRLLLVNTPIRLSKSLHYTFGLQATPVRPMPSDCRKWYFSTVGRRVPNAPPISPDIRMNLWWWIHFKKWFYPEAIDEMQVKAIISAYHKYGNPVITYISPTHIKLPSSEYEKHAEEWQLKPPFIRHSMEGQKVDFIRVCPQSKGWRDYYLSVVNDLVSRYDIDGLWIDDPYPWPCKNALHGDGYKDEITGELMPSYPIFATREMLKRVAELFHEKKKQYTLMVHMSANMIIPAYSFAQSYLDGEQYAYIKSSRPYATLPLDKFRAEFMGKQWGLAPFFILRTLDKESSEEGTMLALLHDVTPLYNGAVYKVKHDFGMDNASWYPYWKKNSFINSHTDGMLISFYQTADNSSFLVIVGNTTYKDCSSLFSLNGAAVGLPQGKYKDIKIIDSFSGENIIVNNNDFQLPIKKRNFRLLKISVLR